MNRSTARRIAPALVALALVAGCAGETDDDASSGSGGSVNAQVCSGYADLQKSVEDLRSTPLRTSGTLEEIQASAAALEPKAAKLKADLNRLSAISNGPVAAAIGEMNVKADALKESLTEAKADAQESMGPKITEAQTQLQASYADVTKALDAACPSN